MWYHTRMPKEFETTHMTDPARTPRADFIRSRPQESVPFLIAAAKSTGCFIDKMRTFVACRSGDVIQAFIDMKREWHLAD